MPRERVLNEAGRLRPLNKLVQAPQGLRSSRAWAAHGLLDNHEWLGQKPKTRNPSQVLQELLSYPSGNVRAHPQKLVDHGL